MLGLFTVVLVSSLPAVRRRSFALFLALHHLALPALALLCVHGAQEWVQTAHAWRYVAGGALLYAGDRLHRAVASWGSRRVRVLRAKRLRFPLFRRDALQAALERHARGAGAEDPPVKHERFLVLDLERPQGTAATLSHA
jgi:hypothetical protein